LESKKLYGMGIMEIVFALCVGDGYLDEIEEVFSSSRGEGGIGTITRASII
jgi:hypothetical protein